MIFDEVLEAKPDPIFGLTGSFKADVRENKVNLLVGIYKDEKLRSPLLPSVEKARELVGRQEEVADYLPFEGLSGFVDEIGKVIFGQGWDQEHSRIFGAQAVGGTGALRLGAEFLAQEVSKRVSISHPTWPNHRGVFERAGFSVDSYTYYSSEKKWFDLEGMCKSLETLEEKSIVVLHAACHNPTGCDPSREEWEQISDLMLRRGLVPFFDFAYQGFGLGVDEDAYPVRLFYERGHEMLVAYSCSKNFSLYNQRVGALYVVTPDPVVKMRVGSQVNGCIRTLYSNPPAYGARLVWEVLKNSTLKKEWEGDLKAIRSRLSSAREQLVSGLTSQAKRKDFHYLRNHKGMFSFVDLDKSQAQQLIDEYAIYLIDNGRISIAGLTSENIDYVVRAILAVSDR